MANAKLRESLDRAKQCLEAARRVLPDCEAPGVVEYEDYVSHNELGMAFEVLVEIGAEQQAPRAFWLSLDAAAVEMDVGPDDKVHGAALRSARGRLTTPDRYPCPCCGHLVFVERPGSYAICPVCFWEDDLAQLRWPNLAGGANRPSLIEAQENYRRLGASESRLLPHVRAARSDEQIAPRWRPWDPTLDEIETRVPGRDYGATYADDPASYFYWSRRDP